MVIKTDYGLMQVKSIAECSKGIKYLFCLFWSGCSRQVLLYSPALCNEYSKTCVKQSLSKRPKIGFQDQVSLNAGQKYCRMLHSAILSALIKLPFFNKVFILSIFEWPFYTGFTVP